jgi:hypothetical protein
VDRQRSRLPRRKMTRLRHGRQDFPHCKLVASTAQTTRAGLRRMIDTARRHAFAIGENAYALVRHNERMKWATSSGPVKRVGPRDSSDDFKIPY